MHTWVIFSQHQSSFVNVEGCYLIVPDDDFISQIAFTPTDIQIL